MSPVSAIAHLAAIALGVWAGFAFMNAIGTPEVGADAAATREAAAGAAAEAAAEQAVAECKAAIEDLGALPAAVRRTAERQCEQGPSVFDARAQCFAAVRDAVPPGPERSAAIAACEQAVGSAN